MAHHITLRKVDKVNALDALQDMLNLDKPRILAAGQIHLGDITRDHSFRIKAQTCQEHFHLLHSRVLCLVQNNERVIERPSPHESKRSHFNSPTLNQPLSPLKI